MKTRLYTPEDYETVREWFVSHGGQPVPAAVLPPCGIIVEEEGLPLAAGWLYMAVGVGVAWLAWIVTNPDQSLFHVEQSLECLVGSAEVLARSHNYGLMFTMTERPALGRFLQRQGFAPNHRGMTQYFKPLNT